MNMAKAKGKTKPKKDDTAMSVYGANVQLPAHILEDEELGAVGLENMEARDMVIPRLVLMQGLSPQVTEGEATIGQIYNSVTREMLLDRDEECFFIPIYHYKEWIQWADRSSNQGIADRTMDPESEMAQSAMRGDTRENSEGREVRIVTEYHNFVVFLPHVSLEYPMILGCCRTNYKKGRQLLALARYRGNRPLFAGRYTLTTAEEVNRKNQKYQIFNFENAGWAEAEEYEASKAMYDVVKEAYKQRRLSADHSDDGDASEGGSSREKDF